MSLAALFHGVLPTPALPQGLTGGAIHGRVEAAGGRRLDGARVTVTNVATGHVVHADVRHGRFIVQGLRVGRYTVVVQRGGFHSGVRDGLVVRLGEPLELHLVLEPAALPLDSLRVAAGTFPLINSHGSTGTVIRDSLLHALPTLNRNMYDFVRLAPQISTRVGLPGGGLSAAGVGFRFNQFLIDGAPQRAIGGQIPPEFAGLRSVPLSAVAEYEILVAPFDVRYGDFAGVMINAVTRAGTNRLEGSAFAHARNDALARRTQAGATYDRVQYGLSLGGPLVRDRVHFFIAPELQHFTSPSAGPFVGQPATAPDALPVSTADLDRLAAIMNDYGLHAGTGGPVQNRNPLRTLFGRIDVALPGWNSRAVLWATGTRGDRLDFSRPARGLFPLTSNAATQVSQMRNASLQLHTALRRGGGGHNELLVSYRSGGASWESDVRQPIVRVHVPSLAGSSALLVTGTTPAAQGGNGSSGDALSIRNELTLPFGVSHVASAGIEIERFEAHRNGASNTLGSWTFSSLDSLAAGLAERYELDRPFAGTLRSLPGVHAAAWLGDQWRLTEDLQLSFGLRGDILRLGAHAPYERRVDSIFGRRTDRVPAARLHLSPRIGFAWQPRTAGSRLRGGVGIFTGKPPVAWLHVPLYSYGIGAAVLRCGSHPLDLGLPPAFVPDGRAAPTSCANGASITDAPTGDVDLLAADLRLAQTLRGVVAWDRRLAANTTMTLEAVVTRALSDFVFVNLDLIGPQGVDRHGRVLYGTVPPNGVAQPALRSPFRHVVELQNTSRNHGHQLAARIERQFSAGTALTAHYAFTRYRDVQTPLRVYAASHLNWSSLQVAGRHDDPRTGISLNDIPHRLVIAGTARAPWRRWSTAISFHYVGESGSPFTYHAWGAATGDLNADGSNTNDPIYVPRDASDPNEIRFAPLIVTAVLPDGGIRRDTVTVEQQAQAFEQFIRSTRCLRRQRGGILERNSCRMPWTNTTVASLRQTLPIGGQTLEAQLDLYNVLNLLNRDWGSHRSAATGLLEHRGQVVLPDGSTQPVFSFPPDRTVWARDPVESAFQLQLGVRYIF